MKLSASQAEKEVGKSLPTITRAIKKGKLSASPRNGGGWIIDPSELFRVWPAVDSVTDKHSTMLGSVTPKKDPDLVNEVVMLREMLEEARSERDSWKKQAQNVQLLIEDQRQTKRRGIFGRWFG